MKSEKACLKVSILYIPQFNFFDKEGGGQLFFPDSQQE